MRYVNYHLPSANFLQLGAIKLERDVTQIISHAAKMAPYGIRERFARVQQICYVLNYDEEQSVNQAADTLCADPESDWKISREEIIRALLQRVN